MLTEEQVSRFHTDGVLIAEGVLTDDDLAPVIDGYSRWIDARARQLHAEGKITDLAESAPWERRFALLYAQSREMERGMDVMHARLPEFFDFLHNPNLLAAVSALLGTDELTANPIQHLRGKVADTASGSYFNVPWHQDAAVTWEEADDTPIVTCWLPLVDATVRNGCMEILPGVWKNGVLRHIGGGGGATIDPAVLPDVPPLAAEVKKGGIVFMHRGTPHRSTPNLTDMVRWSLDIRYQPNGMPTGRPFHPEFVVSSPSSPESVVTDHAVWDARWHEALAAPPPARGAHRISM
jgi:phytanoyl-CoA hydroxylase